MFFGTTVVSRHYIQFLSAVPLTKALSTAHQVVTESFSVDRLHHLTNKDVQTQFCRRSRGARIDGQ
jgi:hypothetical protein